MKKYLSIFKIRFTAGLQYRAAAYAGIATQFAWGFMSILMFSAFYKTGADNFPMEFSALSSYIWLQQAFLALFAAWFFENDVFAAISSGQVAYDLCRPLNFYSMLYARSMANRSSRAMLRCMPILVVAMFLPQPYGLSAPSGLVSFSLFLVSSVMAFGIVTAFCMLIYISVFFTLSPYGMRILSISLVEFFSGAIIPLPFLPDGVRVVFELLPFASMQNMPLRIYAGDLHGQAAVYGMLLQVFWLIVLVVAGRLLMKIALRRVVVQGG